MDLPTKYKYLFIPFLLGLLLCLLLKLSVYHHSIQFIFIQFASIFTVLMNFFKHGNKH